MNFYSSYMWIFDGTDTLYSSNPWYSWGPAQTGDRQIVVEATNSCGNSGRDTIYINVNATLVPSASVMYCCSPFCPNEPVGFNTNEPGSYKWYFGDGDSSTMMNPTHYYTDTGYYNVQLIISNACGNSDTAYADSVEIRYDTTQVPNADFFFDVDMWPSPDTLNICPGRIVDFNNNSWDNSSSNPTYLWNYGDGATSTMAEEPHLYDSVGTFIVQLIASNNCGGADTAIKWVIVDSTLYPGSTLETFPSNYLCPGEFIIFNDEQPTFDDYLYSIWFGDGDSLINVPQYQDSFGIATHVYSDTGTFPSIFTSTNLCGISDTLMDTIFVSDPNPFSFTFVMTSADSGDAGCPNDTVEFVALGGVSVLWDYGDGTPVDSGDVSSNGIQAFHPYADTGVYLVKAFITNGCGVVDTDTVFVYIDTTSIPYPWFDSDQPNDIACVGEQVFFEGGLNGGNDDIVQWFWDFDDGATDSVQNPMHTFATTGPPFPYIVRLTATNGCGTGVTTRSIEVQEVIINETGLTITNTACGDSTGSVTGLAVSGSGPFSLQWMNANGDLEGTTIDLDTVEAGNYTLVAMNNMGCSDTSGAHAVLNATAPVAPLASSPAPYCDGDAITDLTATGTGGTLIWYSDPALTDSVGTGSPFSSGATTDSAFYVTETITGCESPATTVTITVNPNYNTPVST
ncbi:PKD domain-containing protein, partial [Bacteroidales bacterium AH-315-I05]|nr:PKD domain-containing protein [Bacteroidales bacterium AH-315-I05]